MEPARHRFRNALIGIDQRGLITNWDKQAEEVFGWTHNEAKGKPLCDLIIAPEYHDSYTQNSSRFLKEYSAKVLSSEVEALDREGHVFPVELVVTAPSVKEHTFTAMVRDISPVIEAERLKGLLAAIVESSQDAIITLLPDVTISSWNSSAEKIFSYSDKEACGQNIAILIPPEQADQEYKIISQVLAGKQIKHYETVLFDKDKQRIDVNVTMSPVRDTAGDITGVSLAMQDITERKIAEADWDLYLREVEASNRNLEEFSHLVSHDLKEPLRGLSLLSSFLLEDNKNSLDEESVRHLNQLVFLSKRMESLISNLLYYSKLGNEKFSTGEANPNEMVDEIKQILDVTLGETNAQIVIPHTLPPITGDKVRIREVFRNLITNAIKYNDKAQPLIEVGFLKSVTGPYGLQKNVYYVKDNGIGIEPKHHKSVFIMFNKSLANTQKGQTNSSGVGLAFAKKIIERHKGHIWLESTPGKGSVFYFNVAE